MSLTDVQRMVAKILRPFRSMNNYVAGGAALNREWPRLSDDMDIFHDLRNQLPGSVELELHALRDEGFAIEITTQDEWMVEVILKKFGFETKVQWLDDPETCIRFFPALDDDELGFRLHPADIAINKALCASRRNQAPRDAVDLVSIVTRYSPLGPLVWAITGKDMELAPTQIIRDIRNNAFGYSNEEIIAVRMEKENSVTREYLRSILGPALDEAYNYCTEIAPIDYGGCLFIDKNETPVEADDKAIIDGSARALSLKDFGITPNISK